MLWQVKSTGPKPPNLTCFLLLSPWEKKLALHKLSLGLIRGRNSGQQKYHRPILKSTGRAILLFSAILALSILLITFLAESQVATNVHFSNWPLLWFVFSLWLLSIQIFVSLPVFSSFFLKRRRFSAGLQNILVVNTNNLKLIAPVAIIPWLCWGWAWSVCLEKWNQRRYVCFCVLLQTPPQAEVTKRLGNLRNL